MGIQVYIKNTDFITLEELLSLVPYSKARKEVDHLKAELAKAEALLRECIVKFEDYRTCGYKKSPSNLMVRINSALQQSSEGGG